MFFWRLTPATTPLDDPYMALPPARSRRRGEPPTPINLDANQSRRARLLSGAAGGWDLKEEYGGGKLGKEKGGEGTGAVREEDERRRPRMGRQRSRSAGEILQECPRCEFVYPATVGGRGVRAGGDAEREEEDEQSFGLQGVPPGMGTGTVTVTGMGRQGSRSTEENPRLLPQPHHQQDGHPSFESIYLVWACEWVQEEQRVGNIRWGWGGRGVVVLERVYILDCIPTAHTPSPAR